MLAPRDNHLDQAWGIVFGLLHGRLDLDDLARQTSDAVRPALQARVDSLLEQLTFHDERDNERRLKSLFEGLAHDEAGLIEFERFSGLLSTELAGIVFTAHPTFSLSREANVIALDLMRAGAVSARPGGAVPPPERMPTVHRIAPPTLQEELDASTIAIGHLRQAIRRTFRVAIDVAAALYPADYAKLRPEFLTVATWVGFDLDGRTDIGWSKSLSCRYQLALAGLVELRASLDATRAEHAEGCGAIAASLDNVEQSLAAIAGCFEIGLEALGREAEDAKRLGKLNRLALEKRTLKQDAIGAIDKALSAALGADLPEALRKDLVVFRAEWESLGLGLARLHFRLNSVQLHNAIRPEIAMHAAPDRSASRRHYLAEITRLLDGVEAVNVHYGTVAREQTTAKRVFMLAAQFQKHFDGRTPVRLLIAESDTPFTLLTALYYARLFGVERHIEISPLFETADGLHHGDRVISELLDNPHFLSYIRMRGRFCVQLGFSDSGRYIGQPAASLAVERFKLRVVRLWQSRELGDVQLSFFDTHGESVGRGAHPRSLADRFLYTHSTEVRARLETLAAPHKHEVSFQGGEGYLWFASPRTALGVVTDLLSARIEPPRNAVDALYTHSGWGLDFFLTLKDYQERLVKHRGYLWLIDKVGRNLLYPTGSRAMQRQSAGGRASATIERIGELRAIPNNAILHQLAYLANSCAGLGPATNQSPEIFLSVLEHSDRLERVLSLALAARERSDITMLEAYAQLMGANYWLDRTNQSLDREWNQTLRRVSRVLEDAFDHDSIANLVRILRRDAAELDDVLEQSHVRGGWSSSDALTRLHTLRLALIQFIYLKAMEIPQFSSRLEISLGTLVERLLYLDVPETVGLLRKIFPAAAPADDTEVYAERDTYVGAGTLGYAAEHENIFDPIERAYALILELSALIALHVGAYG